MPYWDLLYHVVWATKNREPLLVPAAADELLALIRSKADRLGVVVHALNAMPDHVHLIVSIPPNACVATVVGQLKGVSTAAYNSERGTDEPRVYWQEGYGAFTLSRTGLARHVNYVKAQREHHDSGRIVDYLERGGEGQTASDE